MIGVGLVILFADFGVLVYKKFTELMGIGWAIFSIFIILFGAVPGLSDWTMLMDGTKYMGLFLIFVIIIINAFLVCILISQLSMKNQELAMQVSLLNQENEIILRELKIITGNININKRDVK